MLRTWTFLLVLGCAGALSYADEVQFKNGDRLTGKIESLEGTKLTIASAIAGKVTVDLKDIRTFATDAPITIQLKDGTVLHQKIASAADGQFATAPGGAVQPQNFGIGQIAKVNPAADQWHGNLVAGGFLARGNTNADSFNLTAHAVRRTDIDRLTLDAGYIYAREKPSGGGPKRRTADDWFVEGKYDYFFTKKFYGYVNSRVERDLIANLSLRLTPGAGVGYQWFDNPADLSFNTEAGVSWLYRSYRNDGSQESVAVRGAYHLTKKFNKQVSMFHNFEIFPGLDSIDDFYFNTDAGVRASITDKMFTEFKIQYRHDQRPAPGTGDDDVRYIVGVGWQF